MMLGARTAAWAKSGGVLPYLRRVAYLESHGTEWIDTGLKLITKYEDSASFEFDIEFNTVSGRRLMLTNGYGYFGHNNGLFEYSSIRKGSALVETVYNVICKISRNSNGFYRLELIINGEKITETISSSSVTYNVPVFLFTITSSGVPDASFAMSAKLYGLKAVYNGTIQRNYIPVLDLSGRPAMYDEVSGQFFYNQGTGEFTWGEL